MIKRERDGEKIKMEEKNKLPAMRAPLCEWKGGICFGISAFFSFLMIITRLCKEREHEKKTEKEGKQLELLKFSFEKKKVERKRLESHRKQGVVFLFFICNSASPFCHRRRWRLFIYFFFPLFYYYSLFSLSVLLRGLSLHKRGTFKQNKTKIRKTQMTNLY